MHVIATAGHVDHGKSTLVKALTGTDPDRLEEERRRGLSIELGYCWTSLPPVGDVAFVDVPGHERFISTMLAGIGPVPAVLFVVAADDPWMRQAAEHLAALDALGVRHAVLAVTRSDLADPATAREVAVAELGRTSLRGAPVVTVSGRTGEGLDELRSRLVAMVRSMPVPDPSAAARLWVDRRFTVRGTGTVVTGTLATGTVSVGDVLEYGPGTARVRGVQTLGRPVDAAHGVARVALNLTGLTGLTGDDLAGLDRGSVLVTPRAWRFTDLVDVRLTAGGPPPDDDGRASAGPPPDRPLLHVGAASVPVRFRPLSNDLARLAAEHPLPLRVGDRALLRDPGSRRIWGVMVLDPAPPPLGRRGAAAARAQALSPAPAPVDGRSDLAAEVSRRGLAPQSLLERIGVPVPEADLRALVAEGQVVAAGGWLMSQDRAAGASDEIERAVRAQERESPLSPGLPLGVLTARLGLPAPELVRALVRPPLRVTGGRVLAGSASALPEYVERAVEAVRSDLAENPFAAPTADRLRELGLDQRALAAAAKAGRLLRLAPGVVLLSGADATAVEWLTELPQPFTASQARVRLRSSRRTVLPLLEHLDRLGLTRRGPDDRRSVQRPGPDRGPGGG